MKNLLIILICAVFTFSAHRGCGFYVNPQNNFSSQTDNTKNSSSSQDDKTQVIQPTGEPISEYELSYEQYLEFLDSPSIEYLESNTTKYQYFLDGNNDENIIFVDPTNADSPVSEPENFLEISYLTVYRSLIEDWNSKAKAQQWLEERNMLGNVESIAFLSCYDDIPVVIGICTDKEWYFVTVDEYDDDRLWQGPGSEGSYLYRTYSREEIIEKHRIYDADLLINQEKIATVRMRYDYAEIPVFLLFEELGATIQRDNDVVTVLFRGKKAIFNLDSEKIKIENKKEFSAEQEPPGGSSFNFFLQGNEVYIDTNTAFDILRIFGIELQWSRERREVYVYAD